MAFLRLKRAFLIVAALLIAGLGAGLGEGLGTFAHADLGAVEYVQIRDVAMHIIEQYPPEQNIILGVGRSPTPLIAFLQNYDTQYAYNVPLTGFRHRPAGVSTPSHPNQKRTELYRPLFKGEIKPLFRHFDDHVPNAIQVGGKNVVLLDFTYSGDSLISAYFYVRAYLQSQQRPDTLTMLALSPSTDWENDLLKNTAEVGLHADVFPLSLQHHDLLTTGFIDERYDPFGEYGPYNVFVGNRTLHKNEKYLDLRREMAEFMVQEPDLARRLPELPLKKIRPSFYNRWVEPCLKWITRVSSTTTANQN